MPNVGYGTNKKDRHVLPNGFKKVRARSTAAAGRAAQL
jgi:ribosomal protein L32E